MHAPVTDREIAAGHHVLPVKSDAGAASPHGVSVTRVSWDGPHDLALSGWVAQGYRIGLMGRSAGWWIGDWLRFGNARYGEKYARAMKITGYDAQTLMNMVWISSRFDVSRRREKLSWSHHVEVAALDEATQDRWLDRAEAERLSIRDMRELLRIERRSAFEDDQAEEPHEAAPLLCPQCGYSFEKAWAGILPTHAGAL